MRRYDDVAFGGREESAEGRRLPFNAPDAVRRLLSQSVGGKFRTVAQTIFLTPAIASHAASATETAQMLLIMLRESYMVYNGHPRI